MNLYDIGAHIHSSRVELKVVQNISFQNQHEGTSILILQRFYRQSDTVRMKLQWEYKRLRIGG